MIRISSRNTFLNFIEEEEAPEPSAKARSRSVDARDPAAPAEVTHVFAEQQCLDRLCDVLSTGRVDALPAPKPERKQQPEEVCKQAEKKPEFQGLKQVQSNSSVSTMAPDDHEEGEDHRHYGDDHRQHGEFDKYDEGKHQTLQPYFQHCRVPRSLNLAEQFSKAKLETPPTTLMIRNIPNRYSQRELIRELETLGFAGSFDFFYAPIDTGTMGNVGYAFVNFVDPVWAERCQRAMDGYVFKKHQQKARRKVATVSVAHIQGLQANIRHYENAAVNGSARSKRCGPVIMTSLVSAVPSC